MRFPGVQLLHEFLTLYRDEIIARTRAKVALRTAPRPTDAELEHGVPLFLDAARETLRGEQGRRARPPPTMAQSAAPSRGRAAAGGLHRGAGRPRLRGRLPGRHGARHRAGGLDLRATSSGRSTGASTRPSRRRSRSTPGSGSWRSRTEGNRAPGLLRARAAEPPAQRDPRLRGPEERDRRLGGSTARSSGAT